MEIQGGDTGRRYGAEIQGGDARRRYRAEILLYIARRGASGRSPKSTLSSGSRREKRAAAPARQEGYGQAGALKRSRDSDGCLETRAMLRVYLRLFTAAIWWTPDRSRSKSILVGLLQAIHPP